MICKNKTLINNQAFFKIKKKKENIMKKAWIRIQTIKNNFLIDPNVNIDTSWDCTVTLKMADHDGWFLKMKNYLLYLAKKHCMMQNNNKSLIRPHHTFDYINTNIDKIEMKIIFSIFGRLCLRKWNEFFLIKLKNCKRKECL